MPRNKRIELEVVEELLLDQIEYRMRAILVLLNFERKQQKKLLESIDRFSSLTKENIHLLQKNV